MEKQTGAPKSERLAKQNQALSRRSLLLGTTTLAAASAMEGVATMSAATNMAVFAASKNL